MKMELLIFLSIFIAFSEQTHPNIEPVVLVHGGAGDIPDSRDQGKLDGCKLAANQGYRRLMTTGSVLDAVEEAVRVMELDENFNAGDNIDVNIVASSIFHVQLLFNPTGYGSVLTLNGTVEMEASIMEGRTMNAGCCTLIEDIRHPITLARLVMEKTHHTFLGGKYAMKFASDNEIEILSPPGQLVTEYAREALEKYKQDHALGRDVSNAPTEIGRRDEGSTVGAIAIDAQGNVAAATSTGGITGKMSGRIGDTPLIGSGTYADNVSKCLFKFQNENNFSSNHFQLQLFGAVSTTGHGETIMRFNVAQRIIQRIELLGETAQEATQQVLEDMTRRLNYTAGAITLDRLGRVGIFWTSKKMAWAYRKANRIESGIKMGETHMEIV